MRHPVTLIPPSPTVLLLLLALLLTLLNPSSASPAPRPLPQQHTSPNDPLPQDPGPPPNIDCIVQWSDFSCCANNIKTSKGTVLVTASGEGKVCPLTLSRTEYCQVGDADCGPNGGVRAGVGGVMYAIVGVVVVAWVSL